MRITASFRKLLREKAAQVIIKQLYKESSQERILIPLHTTETYMSNISQKYGKYFEEYGEVDGKSFERELDECFRKFDFPFFDELKRAGVVKSYSFGPGDLPLVPYEYWLAEVKGKDIDKQKVADLMKWLAEMPNKVKYGLFSLDMVSGEVYCGDYKTTLRPSRGLFRVIYRLVTNPSHKLAYLQLLSIYYDKTENEVQEEYQNKGSIAMTANQIIKDLRRRLHMTGKLASLLAPVGQAYRLLSNTSTN